MDTFNICYSTDGNYAEQLTVSMASVLKNSQKGEKFNFLILDGGLSDKDKEGIDCLRSIKNFSITYIPVNPGDFVTCPLLKDNNPDYADYHVTLPTYFRFKLCEYFPNVDKLLYLDCDVIVRSSLKDFYETDISDFSALMIKDAESEKEASRLGLSAYYNAGVMLVNLKYWYKNNIPSLLFDCAINRKDDLLWQDQDIINIVLSDSVKETDNLWNYQYFLYPDNDVNLFSECKILHLAGKYKPWLRPFEHLVYDEYYKYLALTPLKNREIVYRRASFGKFLSRFDGNSSEDIQQIATSSDLKKVFDKIEEIYTFTNTVVNDSEKRIENDINDRVNKLYDEINKNYKYTEEQDNIKKSEIGTKYDNIIDNIYRLIDKNSKFYESYILETALKGDYELGEDIKARCGELKNNITDETEKKLNKVYDEITNNYEFTKNLVAQTAGEISAADSEKIAEVNGKLNKLYEDVKNLPIPDVDFALIDNIKHSTEELFVKVREIPVLISDETDKKLDDIYSEIRKNSEYLKSRIAERFNEFSSEFSSKNDVMYSSLKSDISAVQNELLNKILNSENTVDAKISDIRFSLLKELNSCGDEISRLRDDINNRNTEVLSILTEKISALQRDIIDKNNITLNAVSEKISECRSELKSDIESAINTGNDNLNFVNEKFDQNISEIKSLILEADNRHRDELEQSKVLTYELIKDFSDAAVNRDNDLKSDFENEIKNVNSNLNDSVYKIREQLVDHGKYFERKLNADICSLTDTTDKKIESLKTAVNDDLNINITRLRSEHFSKIGDIYEFASGSIKELYEKLNSSDSALTENFSVKLSELSEKLNYVTSLFNDFEQKISDKADRSLEDEINEKINAVAEKLSGEYEEKLKKLEISFDEKLNSQRIKYEQKLAALENKPEVEAADIKSGKNTSITSSFKNKIGNIGKKLKRVK